MESNEFFEIYGYRRDMEETLRNVSGGRSGCLSLSASNQIKHLKSCLIELSSIVKIHSNATGNNFAWAELEEAEKALSK